MTTELHRAFTSLGKSSIAASPASSAVPAADATSPPSPDKQLPPYFLSYTVRDTNFISIRAIYGALAESSTGRTRSADVQVRVGDPKLDNTHGTHRGSAVNSLQLPLGDDREALTRSCGWLQTPAMAMLWTTTCVSRPRPRFALKKKIPRPISASKSPRITSATSLRPSSWTAPRGSSG